MRRLLLLATMTAAALPIVSASAGGEATVVHPGESIQAAVDAAGVGDKIVVQHGVYREGVVITTDGVKLVGKDAVLEPPESAPPTQCDSPDAEGPGSGFCVLGDVDFDTGSVLEPVKDVMITGFTVRDFPEFGILAFGAEDATFAHDVAEGNGEYGITAFASTGTTIRSTRTSGSGEAGIYVGDSPEADATVSNNEAFDNLFGILVRNAEHGTIAFNRVHDNCAGVLILGDEPGPAGAFSIGANTVTHNTRACPATEEGAPISGIGIALVAAQDNTVTRNVLRGNVASGETVLSGGIAVLGGVTEDGPTGTPSSGNRIVGNLARGNDPDLLWDEAGENVFAANKCRVSSPDGLC